MSDTSQLSLHRYALAWLMSESCSFSSCRCSMYYVPRILTSMTAPKPSSLGITAVNHLAYEARQAVPQSWKPRQSGDCRGQEDDDTGIPGRCQAAVCTPSRLEKALSHIQSGLLYVSLLFPNRNSRLWFSRRHEKSEALCRLTFGSASSPVQPSLYRPASFLLFAFSQEFGAASVWLTGISALFGANCCEHIVDGKKIGDEHLDVTHTIASLVTNVHYPSAVCTTDGSIDFTAISHESHAAAVT
jgi:hypothetical protein